MFINSSYSQYKATPDLQTALNLGVHMDHIIFQPVKQIWLSILTYKMASYVDFAPDLNSFNKFETCFPVDMAHFYERASWYICIFWRRYDVLKFSKYCNCARVYQFKLLGHTAKFKKTWIAGKVHYAIDHCFLSATGHLDYHSSMHLIFPLAHCILLMLTSLNHTCKPCRAQQKLMKIIEKLIAIYTMNLWLFIPGRNIMAC